MSGLQKCAVAAARYDEVSRGAAKIVEPPERDPLGRYGVVPFVGHAMRIEGFPQRLRRAAGMGLGGIDDNDDSTDAHGPNQPGNGAGCNPDVKPGTIKG